MAGALGLIVKATRLCNLRCAYCHDWRTGPGQTMSFEVMARMTASALETSGPDGVDFIWHGGEPTVVGIPFYEKALYVQAQFQHPGQRVSNSFQTNATLLTDRWLRFLQDSQFSVSVSLDGQCSIRRRITVGVGPKLVPRNGRGDSPAARRWDPVQRPHGGGRADARARCGTLLRVPGSAADSAVWPCSPRPQSTDRTPRPGPRRRTTSIRCA